MVKNYGEIVKRSMIKYQKHPNEWKRVLHKLYSDNWHLYLDSGFENEDNQLRDELKISSESLEKSVSYLKEHELIEGHSGLMTLTKKGFEVARENENFKFGIKMQFLVLYFTTFLAITQAFQLFNELKIIDSWTLFFSYIITGAFLIWIYYTKIFNKLNKE